MHYLKQLSFLLFSLISFGALAQNVGIGTINPNSSAILDVASSNKGLLLPRIADTSNVSTPAAGLVIYNQADRAPNYFDGNRWNNVADAHNNYVPVHGSVKYILPGATSTGGIAYDDGPLDAIEYGNRFRTPTSNGLPAGNPGGMDSILLSKEFDGNSIAFKRAHLSGSIIATMEIQHFLPGAATPFYSVKLSNVRITDQSFFISAETGKLTERYSLIPTIVGYKDWVSGKSFSYNISARTFGTY